MNNFLNQFRELIKVGDLHNSHKRAQIQFISIVITLLCLFFSFKGIDWDSFSSTIKNGKYVYLPIVLLISSCSYFIRAIRWNLLFPKEMKIHLLNVFWANMVGYLGNAILPARAGELIRAIYLGKEERTSSSFVFATCLVERLVDFFTLLLIGSISLISLRILSSELIKWLCIIFFVGILGVILILFLPKIKNPVLNWMRRYKSFEKVDEPIEKFIHNFSKGFTVFRNKKRIVFFIFFTCVIWMIDAFGFMVSASMFTMPINLLQSFVTLAAIGLASAIPSTPGYVGVYQFVAVLVLVPLGFTQASTLAFITAVQVLGFLVVIFWGSIGLMRVSMIKRKSSNI